MKITLNTLLTTLAVTLFSANVFGAQIVGGSYDQASDMISVDVVYQGGCKEHNFEVRLNLCNRSMPATCSAELVDLTQGDVCRGFMTETVKIPASTLVGGFDVETLFIQGQNDTSTVIEFQ